MARYQPADSSVSPRFVGVSTFARLPLVDTLEDLRANGPVAVIMSDSDTDAWDQYHGERLEIIRGLTGIDFVGFDVVEMLPGYDRGGVTETLAANLAYEMASLAALRA